MDTDVLVAGGGTSGVIAAIVAAERGARVVLVERDSAVGGVGPRAGIHCYWRGRGAGVQALYDQRAKEMERSLGAGAVGYHPDLKQLALTQGLHEAGVHILYDTMVVDVVCADNHVQSIIAESPTETIEIRAKVTIDSTGDGDVCALAGVPHSLGRDWDGLTIGYSIAPRYYDRRKNRVAYGNILAGWVDPCDPIDVSRAYFHGRNQLRKDAPRWGGNGPPWGDELIAISPHIGIREGRRIHGRYMLTFYDQISDRAFPDTVMKFWSHYDNRALDMANESDIGQIWTEILGLFFHNFGGRVPFRCFLPQNVEGLLIGGRALSQDHDAAMTFRMQRDMQQVGEVLGTAAALCVAKQCSPSQLDVTELQRELIVNGIISEDDLGEESKPWITLRSESSSRRRMSYKEAREPQHIDQLIASLGTDDEGKALWWLWQIGPRAIEPLLDVLNDSATSSKQKRGASIALALHGSAAGVSYLVKSVEQRDCDRLPGANVPERWIASLVSLKLLKSPAAIQPAADHLLTETSQPQILHLLRYIMSVHASISLDDQAKVIESVQSLLNRLVHKERNQRRGSLIWSIEMNAAYLLYLCGDSSAVSQIEAYRTDPRKFVRTAAERILGLIDLASAKR